MQQRNSIEQIKSWNRGNYLIVGGLLAVFLILEFWFHIVEIGLGQYLVWQNEGRERTGRSWNVAESQLVAGTRLENYSQKVRQQERELQEINNFRQLLGTLESKHQMVMPAPHFLRIYNSLPPDLNAIIIPADSLIEYRANRFLENIFVELSNSRFRSVFLDQNNDVLYNTELGQSELDMLINHGNYIILDISSEARFSEKRTFELEDFQDLLEELPYETKNNFIQAMPALIEFAGPTTRVALSDEIVNNFHEVAIANDNVRAYIYYLPADWINELIEVIDEQELNRYDQEEFIF